jgi:hypothetical protein
MTDPLEQDKLAAFKDIIHNDDILTFNFDL